MLSFYSFYYIRNLILKIESVVWNIFNNTTVVTKYQIYVLKKANMYVICDLLFDNRAGHLTCSHVNSPLTSSREHVTTGTDVIVIVTGLPVCQYC